MTADDLAEKVAAAVAPHVEPGAYRKRSQVADDVAAALLPLIREREAAAWERGWHAAEESWGHEEPPAANPYAGSEGE